MSLFTLTSMFFLCLCFGGSHGRLSTLSTQRFPAPEPNLLTEQPTLQSLASHAQLGSRSTFRMQTGEYHPTATGGKRARLTQTYAGFEVIGPAAVAAADMDGVFTGEMYGEIATGLQKDIRNPEACKRNVKLLQNIAIRLERLKPNDPHVTRRDGRRVIYVGPKTRRARIAYKVEFFYNYEKEVRWPVYLIDACVGFVLHSYNNIHNNSLPYHREAENQLQTETQQTSNTADSLGQKVAGFCSPYINGKGGNEKTGKRTYNIEPLCLEMERSGIICRMQGTYVKVVDNLNSRTLTKQTVVTFPCLVGYQDGANSAYGVANDALYYGESSGRFFQEKFNFKALPYIPRMVVHYGSNYENAFWDGTDMFFGDGRNLFYPLVALDVIAHELAHGITTRHSDLIYAQQSGGINEAFSDITGEVTKHFVLGSNDWNVGSTIFKGNGALRYFDDPTKDRRSIKNAWAFKPLMDVHFSSGVFNHAFYHMVRTERMNIYDAYRCFLEANLNLWSKFTRFYGGACNVMQAAFDNGFNYRKVRRAFRRVGIFLAFCNFWKLRVSLRAGETRTDVLVKESRSPMFKIDTSGENIAQPTGVSVTTEDGSPVRIIVVTDNDADNEIAVGDNEVTFDSSITEFYIKLVSNKTEDIKTTVTVF